MIISTDTGFLLDIIQYPFMIKKNLIKLGIEEKFLYTIKSIHEKPTVNIILIGKRLKAFP